jgi:hypothetical protein
MGPFCVFLLLNLISFLLREPQTSNCELCILTTRAGNVTRTLLFHTDYSYAGTVIGSCTYNHTIYSVCSHGNQHIRFNPTCCPQEQWSEAWRCDGAMGGGEFRDGINCPQVFNPNKPVLVFFDICLAIGQDSGGMWRPNLGESLHVK